MWGFAARLQYTIVPVSVFAAGCCTFDVTNVKSLLEKDVSKNHYYFWKTLLHDAGIFTSREEHSLCVFFQIRVSTQITSSSCLTVQAFDKYVVFSLWKKAKKNTWHYLDYTQPPVYAMHMCILLRKIYQILVSTNPCTLFVWDTN